MQLHVSVMFNMHKKWSGSVVYAATETRENVTKPVTETQVIRRVSRTVKHVSATFPFTDSCNFVLCNPLHPNMTMHIRHTVLYAFRKMLTGKNHVTAGTARTQFGQRQLKFPYSHR